MTKYTIYLNGRPDAVKVVAERLDVGPVWLEFFGAPEPGATGLLMARVAVAAVQAILLEKA